MRIQGIYLSKFRGFEDLHIEFPDNSNMIVFIGENGSGKSSLLEAISMILRDTLYKHHKYERADWSNPLDIYDDGKIGKIEIKIKGPKRTYEFSQALSSTRKRFTSEERLVLEKNRDLTEEEKMELYETQAQMAYDEDIYDKAIIEYLKLAKLQEKLLGADSQKLADTYYNLGVSHYYLRQYSESLKFINKAKKVYNKIFDDDALDLGYVYNVLGSLNLQLKENSSAETYFEKAKPIFEKNAATYPRNVGHVNFNLAIVYFNLNDYQASLEYHQKALDTYENIEGIDEETLVKSYKRLIQVYEKLKDKQKTDLYKKLVDKYQKEDTSLVPTLYLKNDANSLIHLNEYIEVQIPLILHYTPKQANIENFKDALPMAFQIPMTTDFGLITDWFIEHENEENRKRLRVDTNYRSEELKTIRSVIVNCLTILNGVDKINFADLRTESEEIVKDGQVNSWLSILKNNNRLNVSQLSDGEKRILVLCIDIARRLINAVKHNKETNYLNGTGIVLIDEIEQHLHPKWQRMLLPALNKIFPNLQFIVTTHSPQVLSYIPNGNVFTLENGKAYPENTFGRNNEWILQEIMDDVERPVEIKNKLNDYFTAIREDNLVKMDSLRKELENEIGTDEPELLKADILIRKKQRKAEKNETN